MIRWLYQYFGLVGNVMLFAFVYFMFIFWMAGVAGFHERASEQGRSLPLWKVALFVLVPPVPVFWLFRDMWNQRHAMKSEG